jgi:hypothetical protein
MEKIKASEVLAMNENLTTEELKKFKFFAVDKNGDGCIYTKKPFCGKLHWAGGGNWELLVTMLSDFWHSELDWKNSLREIDFSEDENAETSEIEIKGVRFNLTIEEVKVLQRKLIAILCNNEKEVQSVKDYLKEFEESDREFPEELLTPKSHVEDEENL